MKLTLLVLLTALFCVVLPTPAHAQTYNDCTVSGNLSSTDCEWFYECDDALITFQDAMSVCYLEGFFACYDAWSRWTDANRSYACYSPYGLNLIKPKDADKRTYDVWLLIRSKMLVA